MRHRSSGVLAAVTACAFIASCADQASRDAANEAQARADAAYAVAEEAQMKADELEGRLERLEQYR